MSTAAAALEDDIDVLTRDLAAVSVTMPTLQRDVRRPQELAFNVQTADEALTVLSAQLGAGELEWFRRCDPDFVSTHAAADDSFAHWAAVARFVEQRHVLDQREPVVSATRSAVAGLTPDCTPMRLRCPAPTKAVPKPAHRSGLEVLPLEKPPARFVVHSALGVSAAGVAFALGSGASSDVGRWLLYRELLNDTAGSEWRVVPLQLRNPPSLWAVYGHSVLIYDDSVELFLFIADVRCAVSADANLLQIVPPVDDCAERSVALSSTHVALAYEDGTFAVLDLQSLCWIRVAQQRAALPPADTPPSTPVQRNPCNPELELEAAVEAPAPPRPMFAVKHDACRVVFDDLDPRRLAVAATDGVVLYGHLAEPGSTREQAHEALAEWRLVAMAAPPSLAAVGEMHSAHPSCEPPLALVLRDQSLAVGNHHLAYCALDVSQLAAEHRAHNLPRYPAYEARAAAHGPVVMSVAVCGTVLAAHFSDNTLQICSLTPSALDPTGSWLRHTLRCGGEARTARTAYRSLCMTAARLYALLPDGAVVSLLPGQRAVVTATDTPPARTVAQ